MSGTFACEALAKYFYLLLMLLFGIPTLWVKKGLCRYNLKPNVLCYLAIGNGPLKDNGGFP